MTLLVRRILFILSMIIFAAITPLIVLYAIGYRPAYNDLKDQIASQIGVLLVDSIPNGARVEVNGQDKGRVPQSVPNLQPGKVTVKVQKDLYVPWEKNLEILPGRATEARNIRLFPENIDIQEIYKNVQTFSLAPNRSRVHIITKDAKFIIMDVTEQTIFLQQQLSAIPQKALWSPDSASILLQYPTGNYEVRNVNTKNIDPLALPELQGTKDVVWNPRLSGQLLGIRNNTLISFSLADKVVTPIIQDVYAYGVSNSGIITVNKENAVHEYSFQGKEEHTISEKLDASVKEVQVAPTGNVALVLTTGVALFATEDMSLSEFATNVEHVGWSPDGQMIMVYTTRNELYVYNVENERQYHIPLQQLQLIVRLSRPLLHPQWFAGGNHFIYQVDDEIVITEIDTRDHPISHVIDTTNTGSAKLAVGEDGNSVFYLKESKNTTSLAVAYLLIAADR